MTDSGDSLLQVREYATLSPSGDGIVFQGIQEFS